MLATFERHAEHCGMRDPFVALADVQEERIRFLWDGRLPFGAVSVLEGDAGCGKTTLLCDIAARLTAGRSMPGSDDKASAAGAIIMVGEDSAGGTIKPSVSAAGGEPGRILVVSRRRSHASDLMLPNDLSLVRAAIDRVKAKLVVVDPLTSFSSFNPNSERAVRDALGPIADFAERHDVAVALVRHLAKAGGRSAVHRGAGSVAITALARSVLLVGKDPQSTDPHQHVLTLSKSNLASAVSFTYRTVKHPTGGRTIEWLGESTLTADELLGGSGIETQSALQEAVCVLYSILTNGPVLAVKTIKLARRAGVSVRTLRRAKSILKVKSRKTGNGPKAHWYWMLPDDECVLRRLRTLDRDDLVDVVARPTSPCQRISLADKCMGQEKKDRHVDGRSVTAESIVR
jgi:hypothetical protein